MSGERTVLLRLPLVPPWSVEPFRRFLVAHAVPGVEHHDPAAGTHARLVPTAAGPALAVLTLPHDTDDVVEVALALPPGHADHDDPDGRHGPDGAALVGEAERRVRGWLDLGTDPAAVDAALGEDPVLGPLVRARPGLRVPGSVDGLETALFAVLGQQVSLGAARTFAGRLLAAFGEVAPASGDLRLRRLPAPDVLVEAGPEELRRAVGVTGARARALHAVAGAAADGLDLGREADRAQTRAGLLALPGIGPWTADYVALRCLGDPDAWLPGDLVLRRALGAATAREAEARAVGWRPWRGYALLHLWTAAVFV